jgi:predicted DNA-binding protein
VPFSVRLDAKTEAKIRRLAKATGQSKSSVVREAMAQYEVETDGKGEITSALDRVRSYVGIVRTGGAQYSTDTHAKYRALIIRKHRGRRPR